jgi:diguanylate cyclase (GGDEF)-like protein
MIEQLRRMMVRLGKAGTVAAITAVSAGFSLVVTMLLMTALGQPLDFMSLLISVLVPLAVASTVSWGVVDVLFRVHHLEEEIRRVATYDMVTGVMTRHAFYSAAETAHRIAMRNRTALSVITIDIDDFKRINDSHGHAAGDSVLRLFGSTLKDCARKSDIVGRVGGEEFAILLPDTGLAGAMHLAGKIRSAALEANVDAGGRNIRFTVSIGVAEIDHASATLLEDLIRLSDHALYAAKRGGKNIVMAHPAGALQGGGTG